MNFFLISLSVFYAGISFSAETKLLTLDQLNCLGKFASRGVDSGQDVNFARMVAISVRTSQWMQGSTSLDWMDPAAGAFVCSGFAINSDQILTNASCIQDGEQSLNGNKSTRFNANLVQVMALANPLSGFPDYFAYGQELRLSVKSIVVHPNYTMTDSTHPFDPVVSDIAILTLSSPIPNRLMSSHDLAWGNESDSEMKPLLLSQHVTGFNGGGVALNANNACGNIVKKLEKPKSETIQDKIYIRDPIPLKQQYRMSSYDVLYQGGAYASINGNTLSLMGLASSVTKTNKKAFIRYTNLSLYRDWIENNSNGIKNY